MAEGGSSYTIAEELFDAIKLRNFCEYVSHLNKVDIMSVKEFKNSELSNRYDIDTSNCYIGRKINYDHVYEYFGEFSGTDAESTKITVLNEIADNYEWYESRGRVVLNMQNRDMATWLKHHLNNKTARPDELTIYALSHLYDRHTVIFGKGRPWCTIRPTGDPAEGNFAESCQVHLLYINNNVFAPLTPFKSIAYEKGDYLECEGLDASLWRNQPPINYAAMYKEDEYSDYVEVVASTSGHRNKKAKPHVCTVTSNKDNDTSLAPYYCTFPVFNPEQNINVPHQGMQPIFPTQEREETTVSPPNIVSTTVNTDEVISNIEDQVISITGENQVAVTSDHVTNVTASHDQVDPPQQPTDWVQSDQVDPPQQLTDRVQSDIEDNTGKDPSNNNPSDSSKEKSGGTSVVNEPHSATPKDIVVVTRECFIKMTRLSTEELVQFIPKGMDKNTISDSEVSTVLDSPESNNEVTGMTLRKHPVYERPRTLRQFANRKSYVDMDVSSNDHSASWDKPKKPRSKNRPRSEPSAERIQAHQMITRSKKLPVVNSSNENSDSDQDENKKTSDTEYQGDAENEKTEDGSNKAKLELVTTFHGLKKPGKKLRRFKCQACPAVLPSTKDWNRHYAATHPRLQCNVCHRYFNNPSSLHRHKYIHSKTESVYPYTQCERVFPFSSQLKSHMFIHRMVNHFPCTYDGCKKCFKREADRKAYKTSHTGPELKCNDCQYTTRDIRYLKQHVRVHSDDKKYSCSTCLKGFRFYEQLKCHKKQPCKKEPHSDEY